MWPLFLRGGWGGQQGLPQPCSGSLFKWGPAPLGKSGVQEERKEECAFSGSENHLSGRGLGFDHDAGTYVVCCFIPEADTGSTAHAFMLPGRLRHPPVTSRPSFGQITHVFRARSRWGRSPKRLRTQCFVPSKNWGYIHNLRSFLCLKSLDFCASYFDCFSCRLEMPAWNSSMKRSEHMYKYFSHYFISAAVYLRLFREFLHFILEW